MVALLKGYKGGPDHAEHIVYWTLGGGTSVSGVQALNNLAEETGKKVILEPALYPVLVMFKDIKDPESIVHVLEMKQAEERPFELQRTTSRDCSARA